LQCLTIGVTLRGINHLDASVHCHAVGALVGIYFTYRKTNGKEESDGDGDGDGDA
jgi:hypothetical protein